MIKLTKEEIQEAVESGEIEFPEPEKRPKPRYTNECVKSMLLMAISEKKGCEIAKLHNRHQASVSQTLARYGKLTWITWDELAMVRKLRKGNLE